MVGLLMKAAPLAIMVAGGVQLAKKGGGLLDFTKKTTVQFELNEMAKLIQLQSIDGADGLPNPENFTEFLRAHMRTANADSGRDVTRDGWGSSYRLIKTDDSLILLSDGPDRKPDTPDDIRARVKL